jgi:hypothetical protein
MVLFIGAVVATLLTVLGWRWFRGDSFWFFSPEKSAEADLPCAFGYKMSWIAVKTRDTARLIEVLKLQDVRKSSWSIGIATVYNERLGLSRSFVTPPVDGWSFVVGLSLPLPSSHNGADACLPLLAELSREFGAVQYFISFSELEFFGWAKLGNGQLERAFAVGEDGVIWNRGHVTEDERVVGIEVFDLREVGVAGAGGMPVLREGHVIALARQWSLDPSGLDARDDLDAGVGYIASAPVEWRNAGSVRRAA